MELHPEMLKVKMEVTQVFPPLAPATVPTTVPLEEEDGGGDCDITAMARDDDALLGLHHGAFEDPSMEADDVELTDDCQEPVKRVKATPLPNFEQTCQDIGTGRFSKEQLVLVGADPLASLLAVFLFDSQAWVLMRLQGIIGLREAREGRDVGLR